MITKPRTHWMHDLRIGGVKYITPKPGTSLIALRKRVDNSLRKMKITFNYRYTIELNHEKNRLEITRLQ